MSQQDTIVCPQIRGVAKTAWRRWLLDLSSYLYDGDTLKNISGTYKGVTLGVSEVTTDKMTIGTSTEAPAIPTTDVTDGLGNVYAAGKFATFWAGPSSSAAAGTTYTLAVKVETTLGELLIVHCRFKVIA